MKKIMIFIGLLMMVFTLSACSDIEQDSSDIKVVTTLFPQYDMVRSLAGERVSLLLTLPPGVSPHTYEPTPSTVVEILNADLFIYSSDMLEPWVEDFLDSNDVGDLVILNLSDYVVLLEEEHEEETHDEKEDDHGYGDNDPHYWTDPVNAKLMVNAIARELDLLLVDDVDLLEDNKQAYLEELDHLHEEFLHLEEERQTDMVIHGGHNAIGYFIARYHLQYVNPYEGFSSDAEPTPENIAHMINLLEQYDTAYLFSDKLLSQTVSITIQEQTGAEILYIYEMGNVTKEEFDQGLTLLEMFEHNLTQFRRGLGYDETDHTH